ncbi:MAG: DUF2934 domain-containing protein [Methylotenera sp.]
MEKYELKASGKDEGSMHAMNRMPIAYELELHRVIELAAYFRAEKDGFRLSPVDYWLAAEKDIHQYF